MQGFLLGSTAFLSWSSCGLMALFLLLTLFVGIIFSRLLDALLLGETTAISLGLPLGIMRFFLVLSMTLAIGTAVAQTGLIAFVGLASPHLVRSLTKSTHAWSVVLSAFMGGALLLIADILGRTLISPQELPVGVLTAILGGSYLLFLMHRSR
jgi:iron complex transport system permease protein